MVEVLPAEAWTDILTPETGICLGSFIQMELLRI
jgi:hypothetical protein